MNHSFRDTDGHLAITEHLRENLAAQGEISSVDGAQQFSSQYRHILRIAGTQEKMALVGTGTAAYATVHKDLQ